ncbi:MAG: biopolymer transporter ExbD [Candidatus Methylacidiphilales bacterium]|nr:biopolymer transporter ExbD [Candidatus Methylacidiphilales bacterium]
MSEIRRKMRRPHVEEIGLQIAPMIDVVMLLLFFFMLTGKLMQGQKMRTLDLPRASAAVIPKDTSGRDIINVDEQGRMFAGDQQMDLKQLKAYLKQRLIDYPPLKIYVRADARTPARQIKDIMQAAAEGGAVEVIIASNKN